MCQQEKLYPYHVNLLTEDVVLAVLWTASYSVQVWGETVESFSTLMKHDEF